MAMAALGTAAMLCLTSASLAQSIDGARPDFPAQRPKPLQPVIPTQLLGLNIGPMQEVALEAVNEAQLLAEDAACGGKCLRVGIVRPLRGGLAPERWLELPNGKLWVAEITSAGAYAVGVHLINLDLPPGAQLVAYNPDAPQWTVGPVEGVGPVGDGTYWMPPVSGDRVRIECFIPTNPNGKPPRPAPFMIADISHDYHDIMQVLDQADQQDDGGLAGGTAGCHNDVNCFPAWATERDAVAHIRFTVGGATSICTGTLLNNQGDDFGPIFLTANHCISSNAVANTCVFYWDYQRVCGGAAPALGSVPQSSVATLLGNGAASDYCLMRIDGALPCGRAWVGWDSNVVANGAAATAIHHPAGLPKKISFGTKQDVPTCGGVAGNHLRVDWFNGITLGGSSGSGIFDASHRLFGQLHCGGSACGTVTNDSYGAFSFTYPLIAGFLASNGLGDDGFESNDTCATATSLSTGFWSNLVLRYNHDDWYRVNVATGGTVSVSLAFTHANGDVDMAMYTGCGGSFVAGSSGTGNSEAMSYTNTGAPQDFYINVFRYGCDTRNNYNMAINVTLNNDDCTSPIPITTTAYNPPNYSTVSAGATLSEPQESCELNGVGVSNTVWYSFTTCASGTLNVNTVGSNYDTVLSVFSGSCAAAAQVACDDDSGGGNTSLLTNVPLAAFTNYLIKVADWGAPGGGMLDFNFAFTPSNVAPSNDLCSAPRVIGVNSYVDGPYNTFGAGNAGDQADSCGSFFGNSSSVWYSFTPHANGTLDIDTFGSNFDTVLSVWTGNCGGLTSIACSDDVFPGTLHSSLSGVSLSDNVTYLIKVGSYSTTPGGCLTLSFAFDPVSPANDDCSTAVNISGNAYNPPLLDITDADTFLGEPLESCGNAPNLKTVWYRYVPTTCGRLNVDTFGSNYDTVLSVFRGNCLTSVELACSDDAFGFQSQITNLRLNGGHPYLIKAMSYAYTAGPEIGNLDFNFAFTPQTCCRADIVTTPNGDGQVNVSDLLAVISAWGGCNYCAADIAPPGGDGAVNVTDLLAVISGWGPCPP